MAEIWELPRLVAEFVELARAYLRQEIADPARRLGRYAGFSIGAGLLWAVGTVFLAVAALRSVTRLLPDGPYLEALAYVVVSVVLLLVAALVVRLVARRARRAGGELR